MSSRSSWFTLLQDFAFAVSSFCDEGKTKQHPNDIIEIKRFCDVIMKVDCSDAIKNAYVKMLSDENVVSIMRSGLIVMTGKKSTPGLFFNTLKNPYLFSFCVGSDTIQINFPQMMKSISDYSRSKKIKDERRTDVCMYITNTLAASIKSFVVNHGFDIKTLNQNTRDEIASNTMVQQVEKPYGTDFQEQAVRGVIKDAMERETVKKFLASHFGEGFTNMATQAVNNINGSTFHNVKGSFDEAIRKQSFDPIIASIKETATSVAGNNHAQDGISGQMQG
jgi:hypothetical protein